MKGRVLIVDDEAAMCELLGGQLERRGFSVLTCGSVERAIQILGEAEIQVLVADYNMPGKTGIALCEHVTSRWPELPVILITAFGSMETAISAIRAGAYD